MRIVIQGICVFIITFSAAPAVHAEVQAKPELQDLSGLHGTVTSITKFAPFEINDVLTNAERDLSFEYIEITTRNRSKMKLIYRGFSDYLIGDDVCVVYTMTSYGSFLLKDLFDKEDPAVNALPLSKMKIEADGFILQLPPGSCLLCSDEKEYVYLLSTGSGKGTCTQWEDDEGAVHIKGEDGKNSAEASSRRGCEKKKGSAQCTMVRYREF